MVNKTEEEKYAERAVRMNETAIRIDRTPGGQRFLDRIAEINKVRPLHEEPVDQGEQDE